MKSCRAVWIHADFCLALHLHYSYFSFPQPFKNMDFLKHRTAIERYVGSVSHPTRQISPDQNRRLHAIMPSCSEGIQGGLSITILIILMPLLYCIYLYYSLYTRSLSRISLCFRNLPAVRRSTSAQRSRTP